MSMNASSEGAGPLLDVDMTPLIDVVFLLLIFFMVVSVFNDMEREAEVELPVGFHAQIARDVAKERMIVNIEGDGTIILYNQQMSMEGFRRTLEQYTAGLRQLAERTGEAPIVVRGHKDVPYEHVKGVLGAIYEQRFERVMFAAYQRQEDTGS